MRLLLHIDCILPANLGCVWQLGRINLWYRRSASNVLDVQLLRYTSDRVSPLLKGSLSRGVAEVMAQRIIEE